MGTLLRRDVLPILFLPFIAKLVVDFVKAASFLFESTAFLVPISLVAWAALDFTTLFVALRSLVVRSWIKAAALLTAICLSAALPKIDFHPEYLKFKANEQAYWAAIDADPSPHPKFAHFILRELASFPAGGSWYIVVYDEARQIALPPERRTSEWNDRHRGFADRNFAGRSNPRATMEIRPLEGDFYLIIETY